MKKYTAFLFENKYEGKDKATLEAILTKLVKQAEQSENDEAIREEIEEVKHALGMLEEVPEDKKETEEKIA